MASVAPLRAQTARQPASWLGTLLRWTGRLLLAACFGCLVTGVAMCGMYVAMALRLVSELLEPLTLLMVPGLLFAVALDGPHDYRPPDVLYASLVFWIVCIFCFLALRARSRSLPR